ncbi:MAG: SNF2-related protein [Candidatus Binataceae bacterium]
MKQESNQNRSLFESGDRVRLRSQPEKVGVVLANPRQIAGEFWYTVDLGPGDRGDHPESDLESYNSKSESVADMLVGGQYAGREEFSRLVTDLKLKVALRSQIYALDASRTSFYAYQFKPLLKFLDSRNGRLLIADEVGLGKTIEAGLIITELQQRRTMRRILIVVPANLRIKWQRELRRRFDLDFEILTKPAIIDFLHRFDEQGEETELRGIVSLETIRGQSVRERFEQVGPDLDLVVFDEAGRLRHPSTHSHHAAEELIELASGGGALLLTATPVQTGDEDLLNLLKLVAPDEFQSVELFRQRLRANEPVLKASQAVRIGRVSEAANILRRTEQGPLAARFRENPLYHDVLERLIRAEHPDRRALIEFQRDLNGLNVLAHVLSRTRKADVQETKPQRRARVCVVDPSPEERTFYREITEDTRDRMIRAGTSVGGAFGTIQPQRQAASCMVAAIDYWRIREGGELDSDPAELSDFNDEDFENGDDRSNALPRELDEYAWRRDQLFRDDSKWNGLCKIVREVEAEEAGAKIVVFAYFKRTLRYLEIRLSREGIGCVRVDGDVPTSPEDPDNDERQRRIDRFKTDARIRVLLSSEVGDEGIDLQFAHYLVNYDLPWNPMRIEQRIGRLDRIGQQSKVVTVINLVMADTIEERILNRLYERIRIFEESIGDLEMILGEQIRDLERELLSNKLTAEEEARRIEQVANAIEHRRQDFQRFEVESRRLVGNDDFFIQEIEQARRRRRYVSGAELLIYVRDFLATNYRSCLLKEVEANVFSVRVSDELRQFVRDARIPAKDYGLKLFLKRSAEAPNEELIFTTSPEIAQARNGIEFLTFHHPLVRAIKHHFDEHEADLHPVSYVRVKCDAAPAGAYVWFLYLTVITGARPLRDMEVVCFSLADDEPVSADASELLFAAMLASAEQVPSGRRKARVPEEFCASAEETLVTRLNARLEEQRRSNDALVQNRLASLREGFARNRTRITQLIDFARLNRQRETYIKGLETRLRNLKSQQTERERQIEATRQLGRTFNLRGAGIVEVRDGEPERPT